MNLNDPKYAPYINMVNNRRNRNQDWDFIDYLGKDNDTELGQSLEAFAETNFCDPITTDEWHELVQWAQDVETPHTTDPNRLQVSSLLNSNWQRYKARLQNSGKMTWPAIERLEGECREVLKELKLITDDEPVKGLVVGNVQSGKTACMAGLIAMAADSGINFVIVLTGMIDNLREQTLKRLAKDLDGDNNVHDNQQAITWFFIENPQNHDGRLSLDARVGGDINQNRYITVCLKNPTRLRNMLRFLQNTVPQEQRGNLKILIIDDECDQASVNTRDIERERDFASIINREIVALCEHHGARQFIDDNGRHQWSYEEPGRSYGAVNYVGFTATPFATVLNETGATSLFPKDFIHVLNTSPLYWGADRIFNDFEDDDELYPVHVTHPFLNEIKWNAAQDAAGQQNDPDEIQQLGAIMKCGDEDNLPEIPESLKDALIWFICAGAVQRKNNHSKPISMLVHVSNRQDWQSRIHKAVSIYYDTMSEPFRRGEEDTDNCNRIKDKFVAVYNEQRRHLNKERFNAVFGASYYDGERMEIKELPEFDEIWPQIKEILSHGKQQIEIDQENRRHHYYSRGVHFCLDNSQNNAPVHDNDNDYRQYTKRIHYPDPERNPPDFATLFIVVGGNTLARGLTLEGLVCSYFVRDSKQADTLLQMGRWFGYRIGYELLPRIWMTRRTMKCFWALGLLDEAMRDELRRWQKSPDHSQGPRVPVLSEYVPRMILTGRNRQQAARVFTPLGRKHQHLLLDYNIEPNVLASNKQLAVNFIQSLGAWEDSTQNRSLYHTDIDWAHIRSFIENFNVCEDSKNFNGQDLQKVINYGEENINQPWTVILPGKERPAEDEFSFTDSIGHDHHLIKKSRTISGLDEAGCIMRFQTIAMPEEFIVDIDAERDLGDATKTWGSENKKGLGPDEYRKAAGKSGIPLLVIKNLIPKDGGRQIHLADDLITFYLYLPEPDRNDNDNRWRAFLAANIEEPNDGNGQIDEADVLEDNQQA